MDSSEAGISWTLWVLQTPSHSTLVHWWFQRLTGEAEAQVLQALARVPLLLTTWAEYVARAWAGRLPEGCLCASNCCGFDQTRCQATGKAQSWGLWVCPEPGWVRGSPPTCTPRASSAGLCSLLTHPPWVCGVPSMGGLGLPSQGPRNQNDTEYQTSRPRLSLAHSPPYSHPVQLELGPGLR